MGNDIDNAMSNIVRTIRDTGARIVLIDGFQSIAAAVPDPHAARQMLSSLTMQLPFLGVSSLITLTGDSRSPANGPEYTTTDVVIGLDYAVVGRRHVRLLEVVKRRGGPILAGQHGYILDKRGFTVYPRLEVYPLPGERERPKGRAPFGLAELDNLLNGGPNAGTTTILAGAPGAGKTTLVLHWALALKG
jgi:circadian clock protein KaiC